jgi:hypothetical protein
MPHDAKRRRGRARLRYYKCLLPMIVVAANTCGCSSATPYSHPAFSKQMETIKSIAVLPPNVAVYGGSSQTLMREKSESAQAQLKEAIATRFRLSERFTSNYFVPDQNAALAEEFNSLRPYKEMGACLPTPILALRQAVNADALLVTRAMELNWRDDPESKPDLPRLALSALLHPASTALVTPVLLVGAVVSTRVRQALFGGGLTALQICLVDARTGDNLWSYLQEFTGANALQDPEIVRTTIDEAFKNFRSGFARDMEAPEKPKESIF